jgi:hypothetical protein
MSPRRTLGLYSHPLGNNRSNITRYLPEYFELKSLKMLIEVISAQRRCKVLEWSDLMPDCLALKVTRLACVMLTRSVISKVAMMWPC